MRRTSGILLGLLSIFLVSDLNCSRNRNPFEGRALTIGQPIPDDIMASELEKYNVQGASVVVVHEGRIDWAKGYGVLEHGKPERVDTATLFQAASISKPVSAVVALRMVAMGKMNLDEDVNQKLDSWKIPPNQFTRDRSITLRMLLSHSSGLPMHGVPEFNADDSVPTLLQILDGHWSKATDSVRVVSEPGREFRYSGGGYIVLQVLLGDITRRPFDELARELVLEPAGMASSTFEQPLPEHMRSRAAVGHYANGTPLRGGWHTLPEQAAGGLWTTPRDLALFMIQLWQSYQGKSTVLLPRDLARQMLTRQIDDYGLGISLPSAGVFRFQHSGGNGGYRCMMVLSVNVPDGVVIMTNSDSGEPLIWEVFGGIARAYGWSG